MVDFYCAACGETSGLDDFGTVAPGEMEVTCPKCKITVLVKIGYYEVEEDDGNN